MWLAVLEPIKSPGFEEHPLSVEREGGTECSLCEEWDLWPGF